MTDDEKKAQMAARNAAVCTLYAEGSKLREIASAHRISRGRVLQILKEANVWKPYVKGDRTEYLGVNVSSETKEALRDKAEDEGKSVSHFVSDVLDAAVK